MTRHLHIVTPWDDPESYRPEIVEYYEGLARKARAMPSARATRLSARAVFHRLGHSASVAFARLIDGDGFYLITGAMVALDLVLVIVLVRS